VSVERASAIFSRLAEGLRYVRDDRVVLTLLGVVASASLFGYPYIQMMPVAARKLFVDDRAGVGWLMGGVGFGTFVGALALSMRTPRRAVPIIVGSMMIFGVTMCGLAFVEKPAIVIAMLAVCGVSMVTGLALCNTRIQQRVPDAMRGRVMSMYAFSFFAFIPFGNLIAGTIAERRGFGAVVLILGAGVFATGLGALVALRGAIAD
jgi:MFS family permease